MKTISYQERTGHPPPAPLPCPSRVLVAGGGLGQGRGQKLGQGQGREERSSREEGKKGQVSGGDQRGGAGGGAGGGGGEGRTSLPLLLPPNAHAPRIVNHYPHVAGAPFSSYLIDGTALPCGIHSNDERCRGGRAASTELRKKTVRARGRVWAGAAPLSAHKTNGWATMSAAVWLAGKDTARQGRTGERASEREAYGVCVSARETDRRDPRPCISLALTQTS